MTSSLVGSEMCIRDSVSPFRPEMGVKLRLQGADTQLGVKPPCRTRNNNCLLYTSDAADDM
eukprot:10590898-Prorocentrum_lima.AAC.1